jgi:S-adenosylhomocysteine hydrolase
MNTKLTKPNNINDLKADSILPEVIALIDDVFLNEDGFYKFRRHPKDIYILAYVHCLPSMVDLIRAMISALGVTASKIVILPKVYSRIESAAEQLRQLGVSVVEYKVCFEYGYYDESAWSSIEDACRIVHDRVVKGKSSDSRVVLVDDGGLLTECWHKLYNAERIETVSVQQTASGMWRRPFVSRIPKINVANSAAKRNFESYIIARAVANKADSLGVTNGKTRIGVAGYGAVGRAIAHVFDTQGKEVIAYDKIILNEEKAGRIVKTKNQKKIIEQSEVIFGCTGVDWCLRSLFNDYANKPVLISCSSRDVEYRSIIREYGEKTRDKCDEIQQFGEIRINTSKGTSVVMNGGFPINFDRKYEWEKKQDIVLTRALILIGILQAISIEVYGKYDDSIMLAPKAQRALVEKWIMEDREAVTRDAISEELDKIYTDAQNESWWIAMSSGKQIV